LENYIDCLSIFVGEEEVEYKRLLKNKDRRLRMIQRGDESDPYYLYTQAEIRLQWAAAKLKFGDYFSAFQEVNRANKLLTKNQDLFPHFVLNKKSLGLLHALVGTVPDSYRWGIRLISSLNGTLDQGKIELEQALNYCKKTDHVFTMESQIYYAYALLHIFNDPEKAWYVASELSDKSSTSALIRFVLGNVALSTGRNDEAIEILESGVDQPQSFPFYYLELMKGMAKLYRLDIDADEPIERFVNYFRGKNFIKEAYQKLAWFQLIYGTDEGYRSYMRLAVTEGNDDVGEDQKALKEALSGYVPEPELLKARLLFDGGYYHQAQKQIQRCLSDRLDDPNLHLEFQYRKGRIYQKLNNHGEAKKHFLIALEAMDEKTYYSCAAALQLGLIHEKENSPSEAIYYFKKCTSIKSEEHRTSLHRQAKSGIRRIEERNNY
jgi:predicted Zn-dependent protease